MKAWTLNVVSTVEETSFDKIGEREKSNDVGKASNEEANVSDITHYNSGWGNQSKDEDFYIVCFKYNRKNQFWLDRGGSRKINWCQENIRWGSKWIWDSSYCSFYLERNKTMEIFTLDLTSNIEKPVLARQWKWEKIIMLGKHQIREKRVSLTTR